jgi:hypothetical protein
MPIHSARASAALLALACSAMIARPALADDTPDSPLAGPTSSDKPKDAGTSLVRRDFAGRVKRPETPVEVLALDHLSLAPPDRARVDVVLTRRARELEAFVLENIETLGELDGAFRSDNTREGIRLLLHLSGKLPPTLRAGTLQQQLTDVLPENAREQYAAVLEVYWLALIDDDRVQRNLDKPRARWQALAEDRLQALGTEITQAFERTVASGDLVHRIVTRDLNLTPEQSATARDLAREFQEQTKGSPTKAQGASYVLRFMAILTPEQRTQAIAKFREGEMVPVPPKPEAKPAQPSPMPSDSKAPEASG